MRMMRKICAVMTAVVLMLTMVNHMDGAVVQAKTKSVKVSNGMYSITNEKKKTARLDRISAKNKTTLTIPATVKIGKKTYKVTEIKASALKNNKKIKKLVIGKNVKKIGKQAFYGCKNLKKITIKTTKLTTKNVGKKAFAKLNSKVTIVVPTSKLSDYQKLLKDKGVTGGKQVIKPSGTPDSATPKTPTVVPNPEVRFAIGELSSANRKDFWAETSTDVTFSVDDNIQFTMSAKMPGEMYGHWETETKKVTKYVKCNPCGKFFEYPNGDLGKHQAKEGHATGTIITNPNKPSVKMWYWIADNTPCKVIYHATLPDGISIYKDSVEVHKMANKTGILTQIDNNNYAVSTIGNDISVTIDDVKQSSYYIGGAVLPIVVTFRANVTETAAEVNQVTANITYNYGKGDKVVAMNPVTVRKK